MSVSVLFCVVLVRCSYRYVDRILAAERRSYFEKVKASGSFFVCCVKCSSVYLLIHFLCLLYVIICYALLSVFYSRIIYFLFSC